MFCKGAHVGRPSGMMVSFYEPRTTSHGFFRGLRCGVPPRQTQTDNIASSNPQLVKNAPTGACVGADPARAARLKCDVHDIHDG